MKGLPFQHYNTMDRRSFLTRMSLMAGALSLTSLTSKSQAQEATEEDAFFEKVTHDPDAKLDKPLTAIIIGAGGRGRVYSAYAKNFPGSMKVIGVSDINEFRCKRMSEQHGVSEENQMGDWSEVFKRPKFADVVFIATPDDLHYEPCMKALDLGYHVLLEKPAAQSEKECVNIMNKAIEKKKLVVLSHVLRYAPYFVELRKLIQSGKLGQILSVQHLEPIGMEHMMHSYVRGNWHNSKKTTPIILAKSCHDLDIIRWMLDQPCDEVSAFGDVMCFKKENAPEGCAKFCLDCAKETEANCPFSAKKIYYDRRSWCGNFDLTGDNDQKGEQILKYLKDTHYGRCVFNAENDQCDHYVMNMKFKNGTTCSFSMEGMTSYEGRFTRIMGTKGDVVGDMRQFTFHDFLTKKNHKWSSKSYDGHGGGDFILVRDFLIAATNNDPEGASSTIQSSIESHVMGFRAEESRKTGKTMKMPNKLA